MDQSFLEKLPQGQYKRLHWYSTHGPKPRRINEIPQDPKSLASWRSLPYFDNDRKIFPPYKHYVFAAKKFGVPPAPKFIPGIPQSISLQLLSLHPPLSVHSTYSTLYVCSYYNVQWKMRVCEVSYGLLSQKTSLSHRTIHRSLDYLRQKWFIRLIWRGRPEPENPRYLHSCYELPFNPDHIISWRINHGRKRK